MSAQTIKIVAGNTAPDWQITAKRANVAIDVTGCTVSLIVARGNTITNAGHQTCTLLTPASGIVTYAPQATDCPKAGTYKCDLKVVYPDTTDEILYDQLIVKARKALGT